MVDSLYIKADYIKNPYFMANRFGMLNYYPNSEDIKSGSIRLNNCLNLSFKPEGVYLNIEAPQLLHGNNLTPSLLRSKADFQDLEKAVVNLCSLSGFDIDMRNASITRIDTARDLETLYPFSSYGNVFKTLTASHMNYNPNNKKYGETWYNWGNKRRAITSYCKSSQAQNKGYLLNFGNIMRTETRLFNSKVIRDQSGGFLYTYQDLLKEGLEECLKFVYSHNVNGLFRYDYEDYKEFVNNDLQNAIINIFKESKERENPLNKIYELITITNKEVLKQDLLDMIEGALIVKHGDNRDTLKRMKTRYKKKLNEAYSRALENATSQGLRLVDLYQELKEGFLLVA